MDLDKTNFKLYLKEIEEAIATSVFISFDAEFSGLNSMETNEVTSNASDGIYKNTKLRVGSYKIIQLGLSTFHLHNNKYIVKSFNFYIFPAVTERNSTNFICQPAAIQFLCKESFDFNRLFYNGIPYLTVEEELAFRIKKMDVLDNKKQAVNIDERGKLFLNNAVKEMEKFLKSNKTQLAIDCHNAYSKMLIYQTINQSYSKTLMARGNRDSLIITRFDQKKFDEQQRYKLKSINNEIEDKIGFRKVIDLLIKHKKPLVGHNVFLDLCHVINQFIQPLPDTFEQFKKLAKENFPIVYDTKYIYDSVINADTNQSNDSSLLTIHNLINSDAYAKVNIEFHSSHCKYLTSTSTQMHEAGYDSYITGNVFLSLLTKAVHKENKNNNKLKWNDLINSKIANQVANLVHVSRGGQRALDLNEYN